MADARPGQSRGYFERDIVLTRGASITGKVVDADTGLLVSEVTVHFERIDGLDTNLHAQTDRDGRYRIEGFADGAYRGHVDAQNRGYYETQRSRDDAGTVTVQGTKVIEGIDFEVARGATISGRMFDAETGLPIANAHVGARSTEGHGGSSDETDLEGRYTIRGLAPGAHRVKADADSEGYIQQYYGGALFRDDAVTVAVKGTGAVNDIDFPMKRGVTLIGRITDAEDGSPVAGAELSAGPIDQDQVAWASTGRDGKYTLTGLPAGIVTVEVWSQRHIGERVNLRLTNSGSTMSADFELGRGGTISGTVVNAATGKPIIDAEVGAESVNGDGVNVYVGTDDNGTFTMEGLAAGSYRIRVDARRSGYIEQYYEAEKSWDAAARFTIVGTETIEDIDFEMVLGGAIAGRIVDAKTGVPVADAWIEATSFQGYGGVNGNTDSQGWYKLTGVAPGNYRVKAYADGAGYIRQYYGGGHSSDGAGLISVNGTGTVGSVDIAMTRGASISGRITDAATGQPISGMDLSAGSVDSGQLAWDSTNSDGTFALRGLPDGVIEVIAQGQGYLEVRKLVTIADGKDVTDFNF